MKGSNGSRAIKDRGVIALGIDPLNMLLLEEPVETAPARVGPFLQDVARYFFGLTRGAHAAVPDQRHVYIEKKAVRHPFGQRQLCQLPREFRRLLEAESPALVRQRHGNRGDVIYLF